MIGKSIAHYEVLGQLGTGGMGEVYRARDTRLGRDVALKVISPDLAADVERIARFRREARTLASLSHPNIAHIYGFEEVDGINFLVMELVEGEDLSQQLARGPMPMDAALESAHSIALALEAAHAQGIVHRDLKPANVKLDREGQVKLLDFGLARAVQDDRGDDPSTSPTITAAHTQAGTILGTAAYMSPEQARGRTVDHRADIWSFGVLFYEMLVGQRLFGGETISDTLAMVIRDQPDLGRLPQETPPLVRALIARCLEKEPKQRLQSIGEARIAIERVRRGEDSSSLLGVAAPEPAESIVRRANPLPWLIALVLVAALGLFLGTRWPHAPVEVSRRIFDLRPPGLQVAYPRGVALSPDGERLAYFRDGSLHVRDLRGLDDIAIPSTDAATSPFWSPDGNWLGFGLAGEIKKVAAIGGTPEVLCNVPFTNLDGAAWGADGTIILAPDNGPMYRVSERGGDAVELFDLSATDTDYHTPSFLPEARGILFTTHNAAGREVIEVYADGQRKVLLRIPGARLEYAIYLRNPRSPERGVILYHRLQTNPGIYAVPFDLDRLEVVGEPSLLDAQGAYPSAARDGELLYARNAGVRKAQFVVVDTKGNIVERIGQPLDALGRFEISPDGRNILTDTGGDVWLHDAARGTRTRLTFDAQNKSASTWIGDGSRIAYSTSDGPNSRASFVQSLDGSRQRELLVRGTEVSSVPTTDAVVFTRLRPGSNVDLCWWAPGMPDTGEVVVSTPRVEQGPELSPDGKFVVYSSNQSGANEVFLRRFPEGDAQWQLSIDGGVWPRWSKDGSYVVFRQRSGGSAQIVRVRVTTTPQVQVGAVEVLFDAPSTPGLVYVPGIPSYDTLSDPDRFLMIALVESESQRDAQLVYVEDWRATFGFDD